MFATWREIESLHCGFYKQLNKQIDWKEMVAVRNWCCRTIMWLSVCTWNISNDSCCFMVAHLIVTRKADSFTFFKWELLFSMVEKFCLVHSTSNSNRVHPTLKLHWKLKVNSTLMYVIKKLPILIFHVTFFPLSTKAFNMAAIKVYKTIEARIICKCSSFIILLLQNMLHSPNSTPEPFNHDAKYCI